MIITQEEKDKLLIELCNKYFYKNGYTNFVMPQYESDIALNKIISDESYKVLSMLVT